MTHTKKKRFDVSPKSGFLKGGWDSVGELFKIEYGF
jgi:hypothetical protein